MPLDALSADFSNATYYHHGAFPPKNLDAAALLTPLAEAAAAISRYNVMLGQMRDSELLLAPLRRQEAVVSSRMEGTITTLEEVLSVEAEHDENEKKQNLRYRQETFEVLAYSRALRSAQHRMHDAEGISEDLIKYVHSILLRYDWRNSEGQGEYKTEQNYLADRLKKKILFVPVSPEQLGSHMETLIDYMHGSDDHPLIRCALSHVEFEALHPFHDGNGRVGRMLITLYLWQTGVISAPHFYVSEYFEENRDEYIDRMRAVSKGKDWTGWVTFFLTGLAKQAERKSNEIARIQSLYEEMQDLFKNALSSKDYLSAVNFVFATPVFRSGRFTTKTRLTKPTALRFLRKLTDEKLLRVARRGSGSRGTMYAFEPLLQTLREKTE